ncbi:unnamed protein product [Linum trigynum]|uniref:Uncharacterized protein n=1 Tax=Linum trigynum TaxID=586398 RepID=A0AAV2GVH9_9ROSI
MLITYIDIIYQVILINTIFDHLLARSAGSSATKEIPSNLGLPSLISKKHEPTMKSVAFGWSGSLASLLFRQAK